MSESLENLLVLTRALAGPGVSLDLFWGVARIGETGRLFPEEALAVARAVPRRRAEFLAGRLAARRALASMGRAAGAIVPDGDRVPVWPVGIVGSISHAGDLAVAVVGQGPARLGVDLELDGPPDGPPTPDLCAEVCLPEELAAVPQAGRGGLALRLFSAKEAVYKAEYPHHRVIHGFHALAVDLDRGTARYTDHPEVATIAPDSALAMPVWQHVSGGLILSLSARSG